MKRSTPLKRGRPLQSRSELKRTPLARIGKVNFGPFTTLGKPLKSRGPKMTPARRAARGQECTLQIPGVCNHAPETSVLCHSNYLKDGKGMGLKAPDHMAAFGCSACHDILDGRRPRPEGLSATDVENHFYIGVMRTQHILRTMGITNSEAPTAATVEASDHKNTD